jgi:hypothetical protein
MINAMKFCHSKTKLKIPDLLSGILSLRVLLGSVLFRALMYLARNYGYYIRRPMISSSSPEF